MPSARRQKPRRRGEQSSIYPWLAVVVAGTSALLWFFPAPLILVKAWLQNGTAGSDAPAPTDATLNELAMRISGPLEKTVFERKLVSKRVSAHSVVKEHGGFHFNVSRRLSPGLCLGFVAPWSQRGDEVTWRFGSKLTHLSPLMYGVDATGSLVLREKPRWLAALREGLACPACPPPARLVPHVSLEGLDFATFFAADAEQEERAGRLLVALLQQLVTLNLDGFVLDAHEHLARLPRAQRKDVAPRLHIFVQLLAQQLAHQERDGAHGGGELLLLVPPHPELFSPVQFAQLAPALSGVVLSTANFSAVRGQPGPSAPLKWMLAALKALEPADEALPRLAATMSLHGWDFEVDGGSSPSPPPPRARAIDGREYVALLSEHRPRHLDWYPEAHEHVFGYSGTGGEQHSVYYPTLKSIAERLSVLRELGMGVALWELGSGLDYWWDLL